MFASLLKGPTRVLIPTATSVSLVVRQPGALADAARVTFALPEGLGWDRPEELGRAFAAAAAAGGVRARRVDAVGLPAGWIALRTASFPPVQDATVLPGMIDIAADELFAERLEELTYVYHVDQKPTGVEVSIAACHKARLEQLRSFCRAAGLRVGRVLALSAGAALGLALPGAENILVLRNGQDAEVAAVREGRVTWLRALRAGGPEDLKAGRGELHRAAMALPPNGKRALLTLTDEPFSRLASEAFGLPAEPATLANGRAGLLAGDAAAALAAGLRSAKAASLNFLAPRGAAAGGAWRVGLRRGLLGAAAVACLVAWAVFSWHDAVARADAAGRRLAAIETDARAVRELQGLMKDTDPWCRSNPMYMDAMWALTLQFPEDGTIWLTSCDVDEAGKMTFSGKARSRGEVLALLDRLRSSRRFEAVTQQYIRQQAGGDNTVSFAATCRHGKGDAR